MSGLVVYLDSSALVKLILQEREARALAIELRRWPERVTNVLARIEVARAVRRVGDTLPLRRKVERVLDSLALLELDDVVVATACQLNPVVLRSLDAIHLASALSLGPKLGAFIVYDKRLAEAAHQAGLPVLAPA